MSDFRTGQTVEFGLTVSQEGDPTDPTTLRLEIQPGSGNAYTLTYPGGGITREAAGDYSAQVVLDSVGLWRYRWVGAGVAPGLSRGQFPVRSGEL